MICGLFALSGWRTKTLPGSPDQPPPENEALVIRIPFGGFLKIMPDGTITGSIIDDEGAAVISGKSHAEGFSLTKTYANDSQLVPSLIHYRLHSTNDVFIYAGGYALTPDGPVEHGQVVVRLQR